MNLCSSVNSVEDQRLLDEALRDLQIEQQLINSPVLTKLVKDHSIHDANGGIYFQQCGGGRRVIRKRIGGN